MKSAPATHRPSRKVTGSPASRGAQSSRAARERAELEMTPAERLTLALELSDLCADLATAGRRALKEQS
jgi:hypothetical protein